MRTSSFSKTMLPGSMALVLLAASGCGFTLDLRGSALVNPEDLAPGETIQKSNELSLRVYQLKQQDNLDSLWALPWEAFLGSDLPEPLKPFLASPVETPIPLRPQESFFIHRNEHLRMPLKLVKGTRALLVVARGSKSSTSFLQLIRLGLFDTEVSLCFHRYEVFRDPQIWPCADSKPSSEG